MNRRELFKRMLAVPMFPMVFNGRKVYCDGVVDSTKKLIVFVDKNAIPPELVSDMLKDRDPIVIPVDVPSGMSIDQVVRMFQD
jgi:hypothetical protein